MISRDILRTDLNLLVVFATIYQEKSITKAAEALHVSQPAVSASLSRLREQFNDVLFVRSKNGVTPTNLALALIGPIREGLQSIDAAFKEAEAFDPATSQRAITVSMGDLAEVLFLTPLVSKLHSLQSAMTVRNVMAPSNEVHRKLATGEVDFAVEFLDIDESSLSRRLLLRDEFVCVLRKGHPALDKKWNLKTYLALDHLHISNRPVGEGMVDNALHSIGATRHISVRVQHCLVTFQMLKQSDVCLTIPREFVNRCLGHKSFEVRPAPFDIPDLELWLYWHTICERSAAHQWIRQLLTDSVKPEPAINAV